MIDKWDIEKLEHWLKLAKTHGTDMVKIVAGDAIHEWIVTETPFPKPLQQQPENEFLSFAWKKRLELWAEGNKLYIEGDRLRAKGNKLWAEGNKLYTETKKLYTECDKLWTEGLKLRAESEKLFAEGNKLWAEAILETFGNVRIEWKNWNDTYQSYECHLGNGMIFGFEK